MKSRKTRMAVLALKFLKIRMPGVLQWIQIPGNIPVMAASKVTKIKIARTRMVLSTVRGIPTATTYKNSLNRNLNKLTNKHKLPNELPNKLPSEKVKMSIRTFLRIKIPRLLWIQSQISEPRKHTRPTLTRVLQTQIKPLMVVLSNKSHNNSNNRNNQGVDYSKMVMRPI